MNQFGTEYKLKPLTDIWSGGVRLEEKNGKLEAKPDGRRCIRTGLLGSIRWWYEVVVRGLGGFACDPSDSDGRCPVKRGNRDQRCVVCEFFGCTGWARKFRFQVLDKDGKKLSEQIKAGPTFFLHFTELRPTRPEDWQLLELTLRLIADYGALGGKTVLKPSREQKRQDKRQHKDYGLIALVGHRSEHFDHGELKTYVRSARWRNAERENFAWASLKNFWCVRGASLAREGQKESSFNRVLGRDEDKSISETRGRKVIRYSDFLLNENDEVSKWLAGGIGESKKVFSFKDHKRTFGFVEHDTESDFRRMKARLKGAWPDLKDHDFFEGKQILNRLLKGDEPA